MNRAVITLCLLLISFLGHGQTTTPPNDTLKLNGASSEHISKYATYWIDIKSDANSLTRAINTLDNSEFKHWELNETLNTGLTRYPIWLHLKVKNESKVPSTYWWSLYSHADSVILYKAVDASYYIPTDTALFIDPLKNRDIKVRFLATKLELAPEEYSAYLLKIVNLRRPLNAVSDITTPEHNLIWEVNFFWTIGFFIGGMMLLGCLNIVLGIINRQRIYFILATYILIISIVILQEELLIVYYPLSNYLGAFIKLSGSALTIIGCGLHFYLIGALLSPPSGIRLKIHSILKKINLLLLIYGLIYLVIEFIFYNKFHLGHPWYEFFWNLNVFIIILMLILFFIQIPLASRSSSELVGFGTIAIILTYINAATYYLNYEGIVEIYNITYPNYFYLILFAEFAGFGFIMASYYRKTVQANLKLEKEKVIHRSNLVEKIIETQEKERLQTARDLHDDLGTTLSAVKLIITNSYRNDSHLVNMISKATKDLRFYLSNFSITNLDQGLFRTIESKISDVLEFSNIKFNLITNGDDDNVPNNLGIAIYRIVSELVTNIFKHSNATLATVQLIVEDNSLQVMVEDNGIGYSTNKEYSGMGLDNIKYRTEKFEGKLHITSDSRSGTTVIITFPL